MASDTEVPPRSPAVWAALAGIGCCGAFMVLLVLAGGWLALSRRTAGARRAQDVASVAPPSASAWSFRPGARLDGRWTGEGRGLVLRADGTFEAHEAHEAHGGSATHGTYVLGGNTLELSHADGRVTKHTVSPEPDAGDVESRPKRLTVDGATYSRED